jgi:uncharacterized protein YbaP (TraB family)
VSGRRPACHRAHDRATRSPVVREVSPKLVASLLTDRDLSIADAIDKLLRSESGRRHFIAIGAAHLLGPDSVRKHSAAKGWTITRGGD